MPRPNKQRTLQIEAVVATRIEEIRRARLWSYDELAQKMTEAGVSIQPSAIQKIEKGQPRRRIVVDELAGFARVFGMPVEELMATAESDGMERLTEAYEELNSVRSATVEYVRHVGFLKERIKTSPELRELIQEELDEAIEAYDAGHRLRYLKQNTQWRNNMRMADASPEDRQKPPPYEEWVKNNYTNPMPVLIVAAHVLSDVELDDAHWIVGWEAETVQRQVAAFWRSQQADANDEEKHNG